MHPDGPGTHGRRQLEGEEGLDFPDLTYWGDTLSATNKQADSLRIGFVNIRGFGSFAGHYKNKQFATFVTAYHFDVIGTAENNVNWRRCPVPDRPWDRSRPWWPTRHVSYAQAIDPIMRDFFEQRGGTAVWTNGPMVHRAADKGGDSYGRWSWTRFRGQDNRWLRVISAYRPCHNPRDEFSTYKQHLRLLPPGSPEPRLAFIQDLRTQLSQWKDCGDLLIVMLDANEDVQRGPVHEMFSALELINVMYDKAFPSFPQPV